LSTDEIEDMRALRSSGTPCLAIAERFGVNVSTVYNHTKGYAANYGLVIEEIADVEMQINLYKALVARIEKYDKAQAGNSAFRHFVLVEIGDLKDELERYGFNDDD
jgi:hypothetical protein